MAAGMCGERGQRHPGAASPAHFSSNRAVNHGRPVVPFVPNSAIKLSNQTQVYQRQSPPAAHIGSRSEFLARWHERAARSQSNPRPTPKLGGEAHRLIADERNLRAAWEHVATFGGDSAGPNGESIRDFSRADSWRRLARIRQALQAGEYEHGPVRRARIPKRLGGTEKRTLSIANVDDRVVARAAAQVLEPMLQHRFDERSFCRFGKGPLAALAEAERLVVEQQRVVWICEDLVSAFDLVPLARLFDVVRHYLRHDELVDLVQRIVGPDRNKGIQQGSALSPFLLNLYLHHHVDRRWRSRQPAVPHLRYMDDLFVPCKLDEEPDALYAELESLARNCGMRLKHGRAAAVTDIRRADAKWLGYLHRCGVDGVERRLPLDGQGHDAERWTHGVHERLLQAHEADDAPLAANQAIEGVLRWMGPARPWLDTGATFGRIRRAAAESGFEEIASDAEMLAIVEDAHDQWRVVRERVLSGRDPIEVTVRKDSDREDCQVETATPWE